MKRATWVVFATILFLVHRSYVTYAQKTHARQGLNRDSIVYIPGQGSVLGKEVAVTPKLTQYLGIPYAQPPLGKLRFARPVTDSLPSWSGVRNATQFAPSCLQQRKKELKLHEKLFKQLLSRNLPDPGVSEDCLFLNIFVPEGNRPNERWPVMVWFHGGDFNTGTPADWDPSIFVNRQKVLVVTVAYRLNILGFFTTTDAEAPGNYGMFDQIAALEWIKKNIKYFNGSPSNITIYGHGSGGISVGLHILSSLSKGKFSKAIIMSGDALNSVKSPETELAVIDKFYGKFGCYRWPTSALIKCLRGAKAKELVELTADIESWGPIIDAETNNDTEPFLQQHPKDILQNGDFKAVPLITGYTNNEMALEYIESGNNPEGLSPDNFEKMIDDDITSSLQDLIENSTCELKPEMITNAVLFFYKSYPPTMDAAVIRERYLNLQTEKNYAAGLTLLAGEISKQRTDAFVYRFDYRPRTQSVVKDVPEWASVPHMFELPFAWGLPYLTDSDTQWSFVDKKLSDDIMSMLGTFVKTGDPSFARLKWEPFTQQNPRLLIIDKTNYMSDPSTVDYKAFAFWNEYYPLVFEAATNNCCNTTNTATTWMVFPYKMCLGSITVTVAIIHYFRF